MESETTMTNLLSTDRQTDIVSEVELNVALLNTMYDGAITESLIKDKLQQFVEVYGDEETDDFFIGRVTDFFLGM